MENKIEKLISLVHTLSEKCVEEAIAAVEKIIEENTEKEEKKPKCPECGSEEVSKNGKKEKKQRYICRQCGKSYGKTTGTVMYNSQCGEAAWKAVITDTIKGISIEATAGKLELTHNVVFDMRHKILFAAEEHDKAEAAILSGICELDDTYVLESYKGTKLPSDYWRKPRRHGAKAEKPGISNEYISISTGVQRDGKAIGSAVSRATPTTEDVKTMFDSRIDKMSVVLCDGAKSYGVLRDEIGCEVVNVKAEDASFFNINSVNSLHAFIKEKYVKYRGVATKYLNRYIALFTKLFKADDDIVDQIYSILTSYNSVNYHTNHQVKSGNLFLI